MTSPRQARAQADNKKKSSRAKNIPRVVSRRSRHGTTAQRYLSSFSYKISQKALAPLWRLFNYLSIFLTKNSIRNGPRLRFLSVNASDKTMTVSLNKNAVSRGTLCPCASANFCCVFFYKRPMQKYAGMPSVSHEDLVRLQNFPLHDQSTMSELLPQVHFLPQQSGIDNKQGSHHLQLPGLWHHDARMTEGIGGSLQCQHWQHFQKCQHASQED